MAKTILDVLIERIDEESEAMKANLVDGGARDFAAYRETCGVIRGLATARREATDLLRKYEDGDDEV